MQTQHPVPYQLCYCSICRKTGGGGGFMINLAADASSLQVEGEQHVSVYRALLERDGQEQTSRHRRHFCGVCGSHLWAAHDDWPKLVHPVAGAVDTELPLPTSRVHLMLGSRASWAKPHLGDDDGQFQGYPSESIADYHDAHHWTVP